MKKASLIAAACVVALGATAARGEDAPKHRDKAAKGGKDPLGQKLAGKKVSLDFVETPLRDALEFLRHVGGIRIVVDPDVDGDQRITFTVKEMSARSALKWLAKAAGADAKFEDDAIRIVRGKEPRKVHKRPPHHWPKPDTPLGSVALKLGEAGSVQFHLYEDDLPAETRELLRKLVRKSIAARLRKLQGEAK